MDAEVTAKDQSEDEMFFGSDVDVSCEAEWQPSSPAAMWIKVADDTAESGDEESSAEITSESGASDGADGSNVVSSAAEEEMEDCGTTRRRMKLRKCRSYLRTLQLFFAILAAYCTVSKVYKLPTHIRMLNIYCTHTSYPYIAPIWSISCILVHTPVLNRNIKLFLC